jgi:hypothetical protein
VYAIIAAVQLVRDRDGTHATLTAVLLDVTVEIPFRAEKQFAAFILIARAGATIVHAYTLIFRAVFYEHLNSRPYTG